MWSRSSVIFDNRIEWVRLTDRLEKKLNRQKSLRESFCTSFDIVLAEPVRKSENNFNWMFCHCSLNWMWIFIGGFSFGTISIRNLFSLHQNV